MLQVRPRFIEENQGWGTVEPLLNSAEKVKQNGYDGLVVQLHEVLCFEAEKSSVAEHFVVRIGEGSHGPHDGEVLQGVMYFRVLNVRRQFRQRPRRRKLQPR